MMLYQTFEVAWCTQQRNNARVIPDGTLTGVSFLKTGQYITNYQQLFINMGYRYLDAYVQIYGYGDFTKLNIPNGDFGG